MPMRNPPHPGRSVRENCLNPHGLSVTEAEEILGVARHTLSRVLNGHAAISPEMAIRLEKAGRSSADFWLSRQTAYDLAQARKGEDRIRVERYQPLPTEGKRRMGDRDFHTTWPTAPTRPTEEIGRLGNAIYERDIRQQVENGHLGEVVAIDVETGNWTIDTEALDAVEHLRVKHPDAIDVYCKRVGYRAMDSFGGGFLRRDE